MSTIPPSHFPLIELFLGADALPFGERGVEALLGLPAGENAPARVYQALQERIALVAAHPRGSSPEADVVKLCLQAAAAQMMAPPPALLRAPENVVLTRASLQQHAAAESRRTQDASDVDGPKAQGGEAIPPEAPEKSILEASTDAGSAPSANLIATQSPTKGPSPSPPPSPPPSPVAPTQHHLHQPGPQPVVQRVEPFHLAPAPAALPIGVAPAPQPFRSAPPSLQPPPRPLTGAPDPLAPLMREAARLVAMEGGVTPEVIQQLAMVAMGRGLPASAVSGVIAALGARGGASAGATPTQSTPPMPSPAPPPAQRRTAPAPSPGPAGPKSVRPDAFSPAAAPVERSVAPDEDEEEDPGQRLLKIAVMVGGAVFLGALLLMTVGILLISGRGPAPVKTEEVVSPTPSPAPVVKAEPPKPAPVEESLGEIPDAAGVVRLVERAADTTKGTRAEAVERMEKAAPVLAAWWPRLDAGQRQKTTGSIVDLIIKLGGDLPLTERVISVVAEGAEALANPTVPITADRVFPGAWSVGMLGRISTERDLPTAVRLRVQGTLAAVLDGGRLTGNTPFANGALLALKGMPLRMLMGTRALTESPAALAAIERWEEATRKLFAGGGAESAGAETTILDALERILVLGPEPDQNKVVFDVVSAICSRLRWRAGDPSRARLIQWFDNRRISDADLWAVTGAIVSKSSAEGVDGSMVLSIKANPELRTSLRDAYAAAWSVGRQPAGGGSWAQVAKQELAQPDGPDPADALKTAVLFARLSEAAQRAQNGDADGAAEVMRRHVAAARRANVIPPLVFVVPKGGGPGADGAWAARFLASEKGLPSKLERLMDIERQAPDIGPIDADVLVWTALQGEGQLSRPAMKIVRAFSSAPAISVAVLNHAVRGNRYSVSRVVSDITGRAVGRVTADRWQAVVRRTMVERALELLAGDSATRDIDLAAGELAEAYGVAVGRPPSEGGVGEDEGGQLARDRAAELFGRLREAALRAGVGDHSPITLDEIDRRHAARLTVARGLVHQFIADQQGCVELMSCIVSSERPGRVDEARKVLDRLRDQSREARSVLVQIRAGEEAMLRLWLIRSGEDVP